MIRGIMRMNLRMKGGMVLMLAPSDPNLITKNSEDEVMIGRRKNGSVAVRSTNQNRPWVLSDSTGALAMPRMAKNMVAKQTLFPIMGT